MPFVWAAGASAVAGIGSALISSSAAGDAASKQAGAANRASDAAIAQGERTRADLAPYRQGGSLAMNKLLDIFNLGDNGGGGGSWVTQQAPQQTPQQDQQRAQSGQLPPGWTTRANYRCGCRPAFRDRWQGFICKGLASVRPHSRRSKRGCRPRSAHAAAVL